MSHNIFTAMVKAIIKFEFHISDDGINTQNLLKAGDNLTEWHNKLTNNIHTDAKIIDLGKDMITIECPIESHYDWSQFPSLQIEDLNRFISHLQHADICEFKTPCTVYSIDYTLKSFMLVDFE